MRRPSGGKRWVPRRRVGEAASGSGSVSGGADRLSALPDALLHHVMSYLRAWEVVRTCVLSRRWRNLWASAPCVDLRVGRGRCGEDGGPPEEFRDFVYRLFLYRDMSAPVDMLRLRSSDRDGEFYSDDSNVWIRTAIKRNVRVIHIIGHRQDDGAIYLRHHEDDIAELDHTAFVSCHLKILKLSYVLLDEFILRQLFSRCTSLEELDLKDCLVTSHEISSASLRTLTMLKCKISAELSISTPNLVLLRCIAPINQAPSFKNLESLVNCTIVFYDFFFSDDFEDYSKDALDDTTDDDDDCYDNNRNCRIGWGCHYIKKRYGLCAYKDGHVSDTESDADTYEYSTIANDFDDQQFSYQNDGNNSHKDDNDYGENDGFSDAKSFGGHNVLHSISNVTSLELLADAGEVVLARELGRCPVFSNLKTLSLGEWCITTEFDALVFLLQHSPNLERLFIELQSNFKTRKELESSVKPKGGSFTCKHLQMVKIRCRKDDVRVHMLAHLFGANDIPIEKIFVRWTGSSYLRDMRDLDKKELKFLGLDLWN